MKSVLLAGVAAIAIATAPALAADLVIEADPVLPIVDDVAFDWTGLYVGASAGYGWGTVDVTTEVLPGEDITFESENWLGGVQAGYNHQLSNGLVLGVEVEQTFGELTGEYLIDDEILPAPGDVLGLYDAYNEFTVESFGSARARIGFAAEGFMPYLTGGVAWAETSVESEVDFLEDFDDDNFGDDSAWRAGWVIGAGVEVALDDSWSVKAEYLYADLGSETYSLEFTDFIWDVEAATTVQTVKFGLNYSF